MPYMIFGTRHCISHRQALIAASWLVCLSLSPACESTDPTDDGGGRVKGNIVIRQENNYKATSSLSIPRVPTAPQADLKICWTAMQKDFLCHAIAPATEINSLTFVQLDDYTQKQVEDDLGAGRSFSDKVAGTPMKYFVDNASGSTCANLSKFADNPSTSPPKDPLVPAEDYTADPTKTYMVLFSTGKTLGTGAKSMVFLEPTAGSTVASVDALADSCDVLKFNADITSPSPVSVPTSGPSWIVDWSQIKTDGLGNEVFFVDIDGLQLAYFDNFTVADLQKKFLDLDRSDTYTSFYELAIKDGVTSADLASATSAKDGKFSGFTRNNGVWALALRCSTCQLPAPIVLAILNPS
jgi:hypothetical protein